MVVCPSDACPYYRRFSERAEYRDFMQKQQKGSGKGFGTLGDLLKLKK